MGAVTAARPGLDVRLLGGVEARVAGEAVAIGGRRSRAVLALLALRAGHVVLEDLLVEEVWAQRPPPSARNALQTYVSRLRSALPDGARRLVRRGPGYVMSLAPDELDTQRFEDAVADGDRARHAGRPQVALDAYARAFTEWRGAPLLELVDEPFARAAAQRLTDRWLDAIEGDAASALAVGEPRRAIRRLEEAIAVEPLRERLWSLLLLALYAAGRQVDALRRYDELRVTLGEEVGVDPSPPLRELHLAILRQDVDLTASMPAMAV